jgi:hypothetical protein
LRRLIAVWTLTVAALFAVSIPVIADEWQYNNVERVVAIADIHGAYEPMLKALQNAEVVGKNLSWSGGKTHLVIVGDILDRGPDSRQVMDLLMQLEGEALAAGGRVHVLIGNHEAMNLTGDLRYVSLAEYTAFADEESREERRRWFREYSRLRSYAANGTRGTRVQFEQGFPAGFFAYRRAFASDGKYGAWLLTKPLVVVINGTAFVHGGLSPMIADIGLDGVNGKLRDDLAEYVRQTEFLTEAGALLPTDAFQDHPDIVDRFKIPSDAPPEVSSATEALIALYNSDLYALDGPLWYRGNVMCSERVEADKLNSALKAIGATRVVIGHTPTPGRRVLERLDGRIIEIDTGMLSGYYGGSANVLIIDQNGVLALNEDADKAVAPLPHPRRVGSRPGRSVSVATLEELLREGEVLSRKRKDKLGRQRLSIAYGEGSLNATFTRRAASGVFPDVAAYRLDRLLSLDMVPVTVVREVDGVRGSVQFSPEESIDEYERQKKSSGGAAWCPLAEQWNAMFVFDALIYNDARDARSILYDLDTWQLMLTSHNKSFAGRDGLPGKLKTVPFQVGQSWKEELAALDDEVLQQKLGDVLDEKRLRALGQRRDGLIAAD